MLTFSLLYKGCVATVVDELDTSELGSFNEDLWSGHREARWPQSSLKVHLGSAVPPACGEIPDVWHLHPAVHLLSVIVPITSKTKVDGAGGKSGTLHLCFRAAE